MDNARMLRMTTTPRPPPSLVILAAGMGSRYGGLKQIDPVGPRGEIVLDYAVHDALAAGFGRVVFVIRRDIHEALRAVVEPRLAGRIPVEYAFQRLDDVPPGFAVPPDRAKPWGTGHAVLACRDAVREPFAVVNADDIYGSAAFAILARSLESLAGTADRYRLVAFELGRTLSDHGPVSRGVCEIDEGGHLAGVTERLQIERFAGGARFREGGAWHALPADTPVSTNMWGFTPSVFGHLAAGFERFLTRSGGDPKAEFLLPAAIDDLIRAGAARVEVLRTGAWWLGVTHPEDKEAVRAGLRALVAAGAYGAPVWGEGGGEGGITRDRRAEARDSAPHRRAEGKPSRSK